MIINITINNNIILSIMYLYTHTHIYNEDFICKNR